MGADVDWAHPTASEQTKRRLANVQDFLMVTRHCNWLATLVRGPHVVAWCVLVEKLASAVTAESPDVSIRRRTIGQTDTRRGHV